VAIYTRKRGEKMKKTKKQVKKKADEIETLIEKNIKNGLMVRI